METVSLTIPDMKSPHCQMTVTNTVTAIGGKVRSIAPAKVEIRLGDGLTKEQLIYAIQKVGYNVINGTI